MLYQSKYFNNNTWHDKIISTSMYSTFWTFLCPLTSTLLLYCMGTDQYLLIYFSCWAKWTEPLGRLMSSWINTAIIRIISHINTSIINFRMKACYWTAPTRGSQNVSWTRRWCGVRVDFYGSAFRSTYSFYLPPPSSFQTPSSH